MIDAATVSKEAFDLMAERAEEWKALCYWGCGGMATGYAVLLLYVKGINAELSASKVEAAKGDLAQAESNNRVASAMEKLAEAVRHGRA